MSQRISEELISAYFDGELSAEERALVERELGENAELARQLDDFGTLRRELDGLIDHQLPVDFSSRVLASLEQVEMEPVVSESSDGTDSPSTPFPSESPAERLDWRVATSIVAAVAAMILISLVILPPWMGGGDAPDNTVADGDEAVEPVPAVTDRDRPDRDLDTDVAQDTDDQGDEGLMIDEFPEAFFPESVSPYVSSLAKFYSTNIVMIVDPVQLAEGGMGEILMSAGFELQSDNEVVHRWIGEDGQAHEVEAEAVDVEHAVFDMYELRATKVSINRLMDSLYESSQVTLFYAMSLSERRVRSEDLASDIPMVEQNRDDADNARPQGAPVQSGQTGGGRDVGGDGAVVRTEDVQRDATLPDNGDPDTAQLIGVYLFDADGAVPEVEQADLESPDRPPVPQLRGTGRVTVTLILKR